jgi:hypothetical protein
VCPDQPSRELPSCQFTPGNFDDRRPRPRLDERLWGYKDYFSQPHMRELLCPYQRWSVTHLKRNMSTRLLLLHEKDILRRQTPLETVFDQPKRLMQIEHTRHRSPANAAINLVAFTKIVLRKP